MTEEFQLVLQKYNEIQMRVNDLVTKQKALYNEIELLNLNIGNLKKRIKELTFKLPNNPHIDKFRKPSIVESDIIYILENIINPYFLSFNSEITEQIYNEQSLKLKELKKELSASITKSDILERQVEIENEIEELQYKLKTTYLPILNEKTERLKEIKKLRNELFNIRDTEILVKKQITEITPMSNNSFAIKVLVRTFIVSKKSVEENVVLYELKNNTDWSKYNKNQTRTIKVTDIKKINELFTLYNNFINP